MTPEALRRRMAHGNIYPAEKVDASLANYFRAGQPRRAARARADVGRRPGRRGARGVPRDARHRRPVGDAGTGRRRDHRRAGRRRRDPPRGAHGGARARRAHRRARPVRRRAARTAGRARSRRNDGCSTSSAASTASSRAPTRPRRSCSSPHAENATQIVLGASRQSRWTHLIRGSVITNVIRASGDIDVHVISAPADERRAPRPAIVRGVGDGRRGVAAPTSAGLGARASRARRCSRSSSRSSATPSRCRATCSFLLCSWWSSPRSAASSRRSCPRSRASCSPTGSSRRPSTSSRSPRARTSSRW